MFYYEGADGHFGHVRMRHTVITFWENPVFGKLYLQTAHLKGLCGSQSLGFC